MGVKEEEDARQTLEVLDGERQDWIVVDHYCLTEKWEKLVRPITNKILVIDDQANRKHDCDIILDHNWFLNYNKRYDKLVPPDCIKLLGPKYALLRPEFTMANKIKKLKTDAMKRVFVFFGGSDPFGLTGIVVDALSDKNLSHLKADVVVGCKNPNISKIKTKVSKNKNIYLHVQSENIAKLMLIADFAIGSGGVNTLERLCLGIPSLTITFAKNHEILLKDLIKYNYVINLGGAKTIDKNFITKEILKYINKNNKNKIKPFININTNGVELVVDKILNNNLYVTIVCDRDSWFNEFVKDLIEKLNSLNCVVNLIYDINKIKKGHVCMLIGCSQVINKKIRSRNLTNIVIHESDLPTGKGWSPLTWQIIEGKNRIPISLIEVSDKIDSGKIYLQKTIELKGHELIQEIRTLQAKYTTKLCEKFIKNYPQVLKNGVNQKGPGSYYPRRLPNDSQIDLHKSINEQFNLLRVVDNNRYPAFFKKDGQTYGLKINKVNK